MQTSAVRDPPSTLAGNRTSIANTAGEENGAASSSPFENSLNRRRNTYASLPELALARPFSPEALSSTSGSHNNHNNIPRYPSTSRHNSVPDNGIDWHTPQPSINSLMEKAAITTHAMSEPRLATANRPPLNPKALPPLSPSPSSSSANRCTNNASAVSAGLVRTNTAIVRSARLPLGASTSPASSPASTPPARKPPMNWSTGVGLNPTGAARASSSPVSTSPSSSSSKVGFAAVADRVNLTTGVSTTTPPPAAASRNATRPQEQELDKVKAAIQSFNQRVLEEQERERTQLSRRSSRANSRDASVSALAVPNTQPPSTSPPRPLAPSSVPSTVGVKSPAAAPPVTSNSPSGKPSLALEVKGSSSSSTTTTTTNNNNSSSTPAAPTQRPSGTVSPSRSTQNFAEGTLGGNCASRLGGTPNTLVQPTTSTSGGLPNRLVPNSSNGNESKSPPQDAPPSLRNSGGSDAGKAAPPSLSVNTAKETTTSPLAPNLPPRYADYNDEATTTPPRVRPPTQTLASPVYSAIEVQAPSPSASSAASVRHWPPGVTTTSGNAKKGTAAQPNANGSPSNSARHHDGSSSSNSTTITSDGNTAGSAPPKSWPAPHPKVPPSAIVQSHTLDDLDDAGEDAATPRAGDARKVGGGAGNSAAARASAAEDAPSDKEKTQENSTVSLDSNGGSAGGRGASQQAPVVMNGPTPSIKSPLTALAIFSSTDESPRAKASHLPPQNTPQVPPQPPKPAGTLKQTTPPTTAVTATQFAFPAATTAPATIAAAAAAATNSGTAAPPVPVATTSPPSLVCPSTSKAGGAIGGGGARHQHPDSALTHSGRYSASRSRDGQGPLGNGKGVSTALGANVRTSAAEADAEAATLNAYLKEEELNLSMSTFNSVGLTLAQSLNLRVLNLNGSTISSEGLRGLANIPTLRSICVSHMRNLTTLLPLITPTTAGARCAIEEIDAQFSNVGNDGLKDVEKMRRLRRLDLSMTPISDVTSLARSVSLNDLYLTGTRVDNAGVAGLERVPTLTTLNIARTKVTSLCQLAKSRSLQTLILYNCQVNDAGFVGVGEMPRLATLDVSTTKIEDLSVLQKSRSLKSIKAQWLSLKNCQDIIQERRAQMDGSPSGDSIEWLDTEAGFAGLAAITTLETLDLSFNTLRSIHSLCRSKSIKHLYLKRTRVENDGIGSIAQLAPTLETLVITNLTDSLDDEDDEHELDTNTSGLLSLIGDIHVLARLTLLDLSYTDVYDLRLLENISTLKELVIVETLVTVDGLRGIERIPSLELLDISQTSILSLQFLVGGALALKKIVARSNRNASGFVLGQVHKLPMLEHLDLSDSVVEDMESVPKKSWRLRELVWRWGERRDNKGPAPALECWVTSPRLIGLHEMPCLAALDLSSSRVHELAFLASAPCLKILNLKQCKLLRNNTIQQLGTLAALEVLQLSDNAHITDVTCLRSCRQLRELQLNNTRVNTKGLEGVVSLPCLKVLSIVNTRAEDEAVNGGAAVERSRMLDDSNLRDGSGMLEGTATPAQFRVPRRRRVSFVANDGGGSAGGSGSGDTASRA